MIVYLAGRSGVGKDTIYRELKNKCNFKEIILHTTRPMRDGEEMVGNTSLILMKIL